MKKPKLANPEDSRKTFYTKYLRQILTNYSDDYMKTQYKAFSQRAGETTIGKGFLKRMEKDIKTRNPVRANSRLKVTNIEETQTKIRSINH